MIMRSMADFYKTYFPDSYYSLKRFYPFPDLLGKELASRCVGNKPRAIEECVPEHSLRRHLIPDVFDSNLKELVKGRPS